MKKKALAMAAVLAASAFTSCESEAMNKIEIPSIKYKEMIVLHGEEYDLESGKKLVYTCEVTDKATSDAFLMSIAHRKIGEEDYGDDYYLGDIYIEDHRKNGDVFKSGYIYCDQNGNISEINNFLSPVSSGRMKKYESDSAQRAEFEDNIMNYLRENTEPEVYELNVSGDKDKIVFLSLYTNYAESYYCKGCFIDTYGDLYSFDFSREPELRGDAEIEKAINKFYMENKPVRQCICDPERLRQIQTEDVSRIDQNADTNEEFRGYDMGSNSLYVYDSNSNKISLCYSGSYAGELQDDTAKELAEYFKNIIN